MPGTEAAERSLPLIAEALTPDAPSVQAAKKSEVDAAELEAPGADDQGGQGDGDDRRHAEGRVGQPSRPLRHRRESALVVRRGVRSDMQQDRTGVAAEHEDHPARPHAPSA